MLDIKFVRENPDVVKQNIKNKFQEHKLPLVDEVIALDKERRETQQKADDLRALRKKNSKMIGALMGQGKKEEAMALKEQVSHQCTNLFGDLVSVCTKVVCFLLYSSCLLIQLDDFIY